MRKALFLLFLVACKSDERTEEEPPIPAPLTFVSGTRLRATFQEIDGVRIFGSWQDVQLGKPCAFLAGRCLPGTTRIEQRSLAVFEDDACTARLALMAEDSAFNGPFDTIALVDDPRGCEEATIHVRGERVTLPRVFRRNDAGACEALPGGGDFVRVGPALGPDDHTFVTAKEENDASGGRIVARWRVADDGAREIIGAWDTVRNEPVAAGLSGSGKYWLPRESATVGGDSSCPDFATTYACKATVAFVGGGGCREPDIFALGAEVPASSCPGASGKIYEVTSKIPASSFALAKKMLVGAGRVRLEMAGEAEGKPIESRGFYDTEAHAPCAMSDEGGVLRCKPYPDSRASRAFSDAGCTQKAMLWRPSSGACDVDPEVPRWLSPIEGGLFEVGARIFAAWTEDEGSGCHPVTFTDDVSAYSLTPLDPARLPIVTTRTE